MRFVAVGCVMQGFCRRNQGQRR